jgi:hypothetical protein
VLSDERDKVRWDDIYTVDRIEDGWMGDLILLCFSTTNLAQKIGRPDSERTGQ